MLFSKIILAHFKKCTPFAKTDCQQNSVPLYKNRLPNVVSFVTKFKVSVISFVIGYRQPSLILQILGSEDV